MTKNKSSKKTNKQQNLPETLPTLAVVALVAKEAAVKAGCSQNTAMALAHAWTLMFAEGGKGRRGRPTAHAEWAHFGGINFEVVADGTGDVQAALPPIDHPHITSVASYRALRKSLGGKDVWEPLRDEIKAALRAMPATTATTRNGLRHMISEMVDICRHRKHTLATDKFIGWCRDAQG